MGKQSCLIIAGEKSGEDHAMSFFPELVKLAPECDFFGVGGNELRSLGVETLYDLKEFSSIGITDVLGKVPFYFKAIDRIVAEVKKRKCKTAILIDFQGFNLKLSRKLKKQGVNVLYYVAPQAWVWKPWRAKVLEENAHTLFTILPFEKKWFQKRGVTRVRSIVHPLMLTYAEQLKSIPKRNFGDMEGRKKRILLLPGSRRTEVSMLLPIFFRAIELVKEAGFEVEVSLTTVESVPCNLYEDFLPLCDHVYDNKNIVTAINSADMCFAASGTVTLLTGLFELPTVVSYKMDFLSEFIMRLLVPYKGAASLTNIIHEKMLFPEFLHYEADRYNLSKWAVKWLTDQRLYNNLVDELAETKKLLEGEDFSVPEYMSKVIKSS